MLQLPPADEISGKFPVPLTICTWPYLSEGYVV